MKKIFVCILAIAFLMPMAADAKKKEKVEKVDIPHNRVYDNPYCKIYYTTPPWKLVQMKLPTAGQMAGDTAAQSALQYGGGIEVARPEGWVSGREIGTQAIDAGIGVATSTAVAGIAGAIMESKIKKAMPKMAYATFKRSHPAVDIMLTIMEGAQSMGGMGQGATAQRGGGKSSCKTVEQGKTKWGGRTARIMTMRCPLDNNQYQWTSMVTMRKGEANYMINATYVSSTPDVANFNTVVKSGMDMILRGTKFK